MKNQRHDCKLRMCLEDFPKDWPHVQVVNFVFTTINKARSAIHAAGAELIDYEYSNIPDKAINIDGSICTITFTVVLPFEAEGVELVHTQLLVEQPWSLKTIPHTLVNLKVTL